MIAWERFVEEFGPMVYRTAFRIVGQNADAEDVVQDVFFEVYRLWEHRSISNWEALLRTLATRRAIDFLRRCGATQQIPTDLVGRSDDPVAKVIGRDLEAMLRRAIAKLPRQQAAVLTLSQLENQSHDQIASMLGITPGAVATALHKARQRLKADIATLVSRKDQ